MNEQDNKKWIIWSDGSTSPRLVILDKNGNLLYIG